MSRYDAGDSENLYGHDDRVVNYGVDVSTLIRLIEEGKL